MKHFNRIKGKSLSGGFALFARVFITLCAILCCAIAFAQELHCGVCGKAIPPNTRYLRSAQNVFCSEVCFKAWIAKTAEKCAVCGKPVVASGYTKNGKAYCSMDCLSATFPVCCVCGRHSPKGVLLEGDQSKFICAACAVKPKCFCCGLPGDNKRLADGRFICAACDKTAVYDYAKALRIFESVRTLLREKLGLSTSHPVAMELIDQDKLKALSEKNPGGGIELGLFEYNGTIETKVTQRADSSGHVRKINETSRRVDESWRIYALYGMPEDRLAEVFAHELAHDWMQEFCPEIKDAQTKEGWAEYIAWRANILLGRTSLNGKIESCKDPIYGDGFRMMKERAGRDGYEGLKRHLRKMSAAMAQ